MLFLAKRYLLSKKRQTALIMFGIILGTGAYVSIAGLMLGFQNQIINQLVNNDAHVRISAREDFLTRHSLDTVFFPQAMQVTWLSPPSGRKDNARIEYPQGWFERLNRDRDVEAYAPQIRADAIFRRGPTTNSGILVGVDGVKQARVTTIGEYMTAGKFEDIANGGNRIIMGDGLLRKLGTRVDETVQIAVGKGQTRPFKVAGVFHFGIKGIDDTTAYGALGDVQRVNQTPSEITDIAVRLRDVEMAGAKAAAWSGLSRDKVQTWDQANEGFMSIFKTQDFVRNFMTLSILAVAGFGIYNVLSMMVNQKRKEIAILRSMGYDRGEVMRLFLAQGIILGVLGGFIGVSAGYAVCSYLQTIEVSPERMINGPGGHLPIAFDLKIYIGGYLLALIAAVIASLLPSRAAGKLTPIEIIRSTTN